ncbi:unnamed protein product [Thlaspi arvense]|uniref:F-box associated beta-propeller type 1 domain-containing protein n=1 Tax=Thlaspi arvense TaxID=13288 RepID=A0AAU9R6Q5_THLAR|nr:unnamed protein product [Thlaspi arvense]
MIRRQLSNPDFLLVDDQHDDDLMNDEELMIRTLVLGSSEPEAEPVFSLQLSFDDVSRSCDGLMCIYNFQRSILMVNPSTRWMREVPPASLQERTFQRYDRKYEPNLLGFGKDICTKTYKLVWLCNSLQIDPPTTCEVFDFNIDTWRHVESSPYRILVDHNPTYVDGSLNWFISKSSTEINVISFDCHTEIFQEISGYPLTQEDETQIIMCNLNNRLCVSEKKWPTQDIWTLNCSNMMTWEKMYSLDLSSCPDGLLSGERRPIAGPLAILNNKKLLLFDEHGPHGYNPNVVMYDLETRSYSLCFDAESVILVTPYFQTLITIP